MTPDPRYLYMSELHREALAHLLYGITSESCFVLLSGDVGTGKTTISRCLFEKLPENTDIAVVLNPKLTILDLLRTICEELTIVIPENDRSIKTYINRLNRHLLANHAKGRITALVIDEAQNLDSDVLEQLRLLTNLETNTQKLLRIILIGQPQLRDILNRPELSQLNQRITSRYHLKPLSDEDVKRYIRHRLWVAGGKAAIFSHKAIKQVIKLSRGIPRLINVICDRSLLGAYSENADTVSATIVKKAGREILPAAPRRRSHTFSRPAVTIFSFLFLLLLTISCYHLYTSYLTATTTDNDVADILAAEPDTDHKRDATLDVNINRQTQQHVSAQEDPGAVQSEEDGEDETAQPSTPATHVNTILKLQAIRVENTSTPPQFQEVLE